MLLWLYRLFVIGFPPKCVHEYGKWDVVKVMSSNRGDIIVHQARQCSKCGYHDFKIDHRG